MIGSRTHAQYLHTFSNRCYIALIIVRQPSVRSLPSESNQEEVGGKSCQGGQIAWQTAEKRRVHCSTVGCLSSIANDVSFLHHDVIFVTGLCLEPILNIHNYY